MKKLLFNSLQLFALLLMAAPVFAQYNAVLGPRLYVSGNSGIQGIKKFTYSSQSPTAPWGRVLDTTYVNVPLIRITDSSACGTITTIFDAKQWALIYRGNCEFGFKALAAQNKGAKGVIIVNNQPNAGLVTMGAGAVGTSVTIPVLFISKEDGDAINNAIINGAQVKISLTRWGFGKQHDLAFVSNSTALPPYQAIPFTQTNFGDVAAYRNYTGAYIANTGSSNETAVKIKSVTTWTPTGGTASVVHQDSVSIATLNVSDSIKDAYTGASYPLNATTAGVFSTTYTVGNASADSFIFDNTETNQMIVTSKTFSKAKYNAATGMPVIGGAYRGTSASYVWGPLFYVRKGGYKAESIQFGINDNDTSKHSLDHSSVQNVTSFIFKWKDGVGTGVKDSLMQASEMTIVGIADRTFTSLDSNNKIFNAGVTDLNGLPTNIVLEDTTYYFVGVSLPSTLYLCTDNSLNYLNRTYAASVATPKAWDYASPMFTQDVSFLITSPSALDTFTMIPYGTPSDAKHLDSVSFVSQSGINPSIALNISQFTTSVNDLKTPVSYLTLYPSPAANGSINVKLASGSDNYTSMVINDAVGRIISTKAVNYTAGGTYSVSTSGLASGHYYMMLRNGSKFTVQGFDVVGK